MKLFRFIVRTQLALNTFPLLSCHTQHIYDCHCAARTTVSTNPDIIGLIRTCFVLNHRGLPARCPRERHASTKGAARLQVQCGPAVPADFWRGVRPLPQHLRQRYLQPAVVSGGGDAGMLYQEEPALGWWHPLQCQWKLPSWRLRASLWGDEATGKPESFSLFFKRHLTKLHLMAVKSFAFMNRDRKYLRNAPRACLFHISAPAAFVPPC